MNLPEFDTVYAVSDLHLGGKPGFQIFSHGELFQQAIENLRNGMEDGAKVALVLNGDLVDFLAEEPYQYFSVRSAEKKLQRIFHDPGFAPVWSSLQYFVGQKNNFLVINTGNHDVELALPTAQQMLIDKLTKNNRDSGNRIEIITDGSGYLCRVANAKILCIHGNEIDNWNLINYKHLRQITTQLKRALAPREWDANFGTRLVIDVINFLKKNYPFVDVLKPEKEAVIPLLTLFINKPQLIKSLCRIVGVAGTGSVSGIKQRTGMLAMENDIRKSVPDVNLASPPVLDFLIDASMSHDLLIKAYKDVMLNSEEEPTHINDEELEEDLLSLHTRVEKIVSFLQLFAQSPKETTIELVRKKLVKSYQKDWDYSIDFEDEDFKKIDESVGENIDCIIAGHTHMRRALHRGRRGFYLNTGTWASLIEINSETLHDKQMFYQLVQKLLQNKKSLEEYESLLSFKPTLVRVYKNNEVVVGELLNVANNGALHIVPGSEPFQMK